MIKQDLQKREKIHERRVIKIQNEIIAKVAESRKKSQEWRTEVIRKRSENIENVQKNLAVTTQKIQKKHESIRKALNERTIHKEVNLRVNRGLEAMEKFIQILRETNEWEDVMQRAVYDPVVSRTLKSEARKAIASDFFKAVQRQAVMQTEFINIAAHELRTPIMPIIMNAELLKDEFGDIDEIQVILRNAQRLKILTDNILNVTRIESNTLKLNLERFDINEVIEKIIEDEKNQMKQNISFKFTPEQKQIVITADQDRITQVIFNLINNATKFASSKITISSKIKDSLVTVTVDDDGKGIDPKIKAMLFTKFTTRSNQGTGLGLYISKGIIEAHSGEIKAEHIDKNGTRFTFTIPIKQQHK